MRLIARLDVKGPNLIKGVQLEGLRIIGSPSEHAQRYYRQGADEIIFIDTVASLYNRGHIIEIIKESVNRVFIPITVGGGVRSVEDANLLLKSGADKIAINTAAIHNPNLISLLANQYGSSCVVISIEAKKINENYWEAYIENGRERTGVNVIEWAKKSEMLGAGEILLTSIDREGTRKGFDINLIKSVTDAVSIPVIASGGMGEIDHIVPAVNYGKAEGIAMADILHYKRATIDQIRNLCISEGFNVRILNDY